MPRYLASLRIHIPGNFTLDEVDKVTEKLREHGGAWPTVDHRAIDCQWTGESLWNLRGLVQDSLYEVEANFGGYNGIIDADTLITAVVLSEGEAKPFA